MQKTLFATASLAMIIGAFPAPAMAEQNDPGSPTNYACKNGMTLAVTHIAVRGRDTTHDAIEVEFPTGREAGARTSRLLPSTQTGSGVRYASDITELHMKGDWARFGTAASAQSEAIPSVECSRAGSGQEDGPITMEARAGKYFIETGHTPAYFPAEAICFGPDAKGFLGINRAAGENRAVTYNSRSTKQATVGPVDAGVGQRRFTLTSLERAEDQITLHFMAPGMRERDQPSATAGWNSVSQEDEKVSCVDNDRIVYVGMGPTFGLVITAKDDQLALRMFGERKEPIWQDMGGGYVSIADDETVFHFFDGQSQIRIATSHNGSPGLGRNDTPTAREWSLDAPAAQRSEVPMAYFVADTSVLTQHAPSLSVATSQMLQSLSFCNHLAGEVGDSPERNAQIGELSDEANCLAMPDLYSEALKNAPEGSPLHTYLKSNAPSWM